MNTEKNRLFEIMRPARALAVMAVPPHSDRHIVPDSTAESRRLLFFIIIVPPSRMYRTARLPAL